MNATSAPMTAALWLEEDKARADCYALIARLFHAGPDEELLASIELANGIAGEDATVRLAAAWMALSAAAAAMDAKAATDEYDSVFVGAGRAEVTPYASHYLSDVIKEKVLARLREHLARVGLWKSEFAAECEDHIAGLCEVMRHLIAAGPSDAAVRAQKVFFSTYIGPCYAAFCTTVAGSSNARFYKYVARFTHAFLDVEADAFKID
jgi:TorA maturation chaperone TorD